MTQEALKLALEALEEPKDHFAKHRRLEAITAIKEALAQPERTWVGLSDEEVYQIYGQVEQKVGDHWEAGGTTMMFPITLYQAIEAKLKEKNNAA